MYGNKYITGGRDTQICTFTLKQLNASLQMFTVASVQKV